MFDSLIKKLKREAIGKVTSVMESQLSQIIGITSIDLSSREGMANFVYNLSKKLLGIEDNNFLVPGLNTPVLLSPPRKISHELSLKNTTTLIDNLTFAKKNFKQIPPEKIDDKHRHETLVYLNILISHLENLRKIMENCKKKCPLKLDSSTQYKFRGSIITCLNLLIDFHNKIPSYLTEKNVQTKFYTAYVAEYKEQLEKVENMAAQELRESAKNNLMSYYKSWGLDDNKAIKAAQFFSIDDANDIFDTLQTLKDQSNDSFLKKGKNKLLSTKISLEDGTEISVKYQKAPLDPSTKLGNEPLTFDYKHWLEIYNNTSNIEIKKIAEEEVKKLNLKPQPGTSQIKDIAFKIGELAKFTVNKLHPPPESDLIRCLYQLLNYTRAGSNKEPTLLDVQKLNTNFVTKIIKQFAAMQKLKKQTQNTYPYLKIKDNENTNDSIEKVKELLNYTLDYPTATARICKLSDAKGTTITLPEITNNTINLKKFKDSLLDINKEIWGSDDDTDPSKISRLQELHSAMSLYLDLTNTWKAQVNNLSKQLDSAKVDKKPTGILAEAVTCMSKNQTIISDNPALKSIAKKIKVLQLSPFGSHSKKLTEYCKQLVAGVNLVLAENNEPSSRTTPTATLKTKHDIKDRTKTDPKLKNYITMQTYYYEKLSYIKKHPKHYANITNILKKLTLDNPLWALANLNQIDNIYKQFTIYQTNLIEYPFLYNETCGPNEEFLDDILKLPLIQHDSKTKAKAQSLRKLTEKFQHDQYGGTPEDYIELNQKIQSLRQKSNEKFYNDMKSYKEKDYEHEKVKMNLKQQEEMDKIMDKIGTNIQPNTDYLEIYKKFIGILTEKSPDLKGQMDGPNETKKTGLRNIKSVISNKLHSSRNIKFSHAKDNS